MSSAYFDRSHLPRFGQIGRGNRAAADQFFAWYGLATGAGALSVPQKCLVALAVAHALPCVYCIDAYTSNCQENGLDLEEMTDAVHVAASVKASSVLAHARQMVSQAQHRAIGGASTLPSSSYYDRDHVAADATLAQTGGAAAARLAQWLESAADAGNLPVLDKALIGVGVAHSIQCPYSIEWWTQRALLAGADLAQLTESVQVAAAIRGGATLVTGIQMLDQVDQRTM
jgi:alkylhydroperoxidase/carboxymuconolactone decarboxylase family protein